MISVTPTLQVILEEEDGMPTMLVASNLLTTRECAAWIAWGEATGFAREAHAQTRFVAHRDNGRLSVQSPAIADAIFERLRPLVPPEIDGGRRLCGCNPNVRLYKYEAGQRFGPHVDQSNELEDGATEFTVLLYLGDEGVEGGETIFYWDHAHASSAEAFRCAPRAGNALVHAHGERCLTHEGAAVRRGVKYLLRTDLAYTLRA